MTLAEILREAAIPHAKGVQRRYNKAKNRYTNISIVLPYQKGLCEHTTSLTEMNEIFGVYREESGEYNWQNQVSETDLLLTQPTALSDVSSVLARKGYRSQWIKWHTFAQGNGGEVIEDTYGGAAEVVSNTEDVNRFWQKQVGLFTRHYDRGASSSKENLIGITHVVIVANIKTSKHGGAADGLIRNQTTSERIRVACDKRGILEVQQPRWDTRCLKWALLRYFTEDVKMKHKDRSTTLDRWYEDQDDCYHIDKHFGEFFDTGIDCTQPASHRHSRALKAFEHDNSLQISVYQWDEDEEDVEKVRTSRNLGVVDHITLFLHRSGNQHHYAYVAHPKYIFFFNPPQKAWACGRCWHYWSCGVKVRVDGRRLENKQAQDLHHQSCMHQKTTQRLTFDKVEDEYKITKKELPVPVRIYADFEASQRSPEALGLEGFDKTHTSHKAVSFHLVICADFPFPGATPMPLVDGDRTFSSFVRSEPIYVGDDAAARFLERLFDLRMMLLKAYADAKRQFEAPVNGRDLFEAALSRGLCERCLEPDQLHMHHNHLNGDYIACLCNKCNLGITVPDFTIHVYFHNMNYDLGLCIHALPTCVPLHTSFQRWNSKKKEMVDYEFGVQMTGESITRMKALNIVVMEKDVGCATTQRESTVTISIRDSMAHMNGSLGAMMAKMMQPTNRHHCRIMKKFVQGMDEKSVEEPLQHLLDGKPSFAYEAITSAASLDGPLPPRETFTNHLPITKVISDEDWNKVQAVRERLGWTTFRQEHDHYLLHDTCGLADLMENYRFTKWRTYGIDPLWYLTLPGVSYAIFLKGHFGNERVPQTLPLIKDRDHFCWLEGCKRGGISIVGTQREAFSNHPHDEDYDETKPIRSLVYSDATNLYGWCQTQPLPCTLMEELDDPDAALEANENVDYTKEGDYYFFEVDTHYPEKLHDLHKDLPFLCSHKVIEADELSRHAWSVWENETRGKAYHSEKKLVVSFEDLHHHKVCGDELQLAIDHGVRVTKVHRAFKCQAKCIMKPFIEDCKRNRDKARNADPPDELAADMHKLAGNSVYGKTMENKRDRSRIDFLFNDETERYERITNKPSFENAILSVGEDYYENLMDILKCKVTSLPMDVPLYLGVAILSKSKVKMYSHWYKMKELYKDDLILHFMDTDSLCFSLLRDYYAELKKDKKDSPIREIFDLKGHTDPELVALPNPNKEALGFLKDESAPNRLVHVLCLRSKMYMTQTTQGGIRGPVNWRSLQQKLKGVPKQVVKNCLGVDDWSTSTEGPVLHFNGIRQNALNSQQAKHDANEPEAYNNHTVRLNKRTTSNFYDKAFLLSDDLCLPYGYCGSQRELYEQCKRQRTE